MILLKNRLLKTLAITFSIVMFAASSGWSQFSPPLKDSVYSTTLKESRTIEIILPTKYASDTTHYDVWYVIDGEWNTKTFADIYSYLFSIGFAPPAIIVGIPNRYINGFNLRDRDLTPTKSSEVDSSGGADHFLEFLEKELMPHMQSTYRTSGESGLFGASFGGLFTLYALIQRPSLFRFYVTADPAFQFDNQLLPKIAQQRLTTLPVSNTVLNIGGRSGPSYHSMGRDKMDSILRASAPSGLHWRSLLYDNETHISSLFKSAYDGIKYAYLGYLSRNADFHLTGGTVLKNRPVRLFFGNENAEIHYSNDGSVPTLNSPSVSDFIMVSDPQKIIVKSFSSSGRYDRIIPMHLHAGDYIVPVKASRKLPKIDSNWKSDGSGVMSGVVTIPRDGYYVLQLTPSEGTKLLFNDSLWVNADASMGHARQTIILPLRKGDYPLHLEHPKNADAPLLNFGLYYSEDGQDDWWRNMVLKW